MKRYHVCFDVEGEWLGDDTKLSESNLAESLKSVLEGENPIHALRYHTWTNDCSVSNVVVEKKETA